MVPLISHVEDALAGGGLVQLREVQAHRILAAGSEVRQGVGAGAVAFALVHRRGRRVGHAADGDGVGDRALGAAAAVLVGGERRDCAAAAGVDAIDRGRGRAHGDAGGAADAAALGGDRVRPAAGRAGGEEAAGADGAAAAHLQVKVGWVARLVANWSRAVAVNCWVAETFTVAVVGARTMLVRVWLTVTATELVAVRLPWS